jgi:hypothetical protein
MKTVLIAVVVVVLMAGSGAAGYYFGNQNGLTTAQNIRSEFFTQRTGGTGTGGQTANGTPQAQGTRGTGQGGQGATAFGRPTAAGVVKSVQGNNITVTQQDGTATTVTVDDKTQYEKLVSGTLADVTAGLRIVVTDQGGIKRIQLTPATTQ